MKRKVVRHGPATYVVSLPSHWIKEYGVQKGDELEVEQEEGTLHISTEIIRRKVRITIDISKLQPRLVDRFLARTYQKGYDEVEIIHNNIELLRVIEEKVHELIGFEIIEKNDRKCLIKCISSNLELDFDNSIRRAFLITKEMIETLTSAYRLKEYETLKNLYLKDFEVNRLTYFCLRQLNKEQYITHDRAQQKLVLYYLIESLEDLGDAVKRAAGKLAIAGVFNKNIAEVLQKVQNHYEVSYKYFYKASKQLANEAYNLYLEIQQLIEKLLATNPSGVEGIALYQIYESSHIIYHFTTMRLDYLEE